MIEASCAAVAEASRRSVTSRTAAMTRGPSPVSMADSEISAGKVAAVAAAAGQLHARAHRPGYRIGDIPGPALRVHRAGRLGDQHLDQLALQLLPPVPEQPLGLRVDQGDPAAGRHEHHRVRSRVQKREPIPGHLYFAHT